MQLAVAVACLEAWAAVVMEVAEWRLSGSWLQAVLLAEVAEVAEVAEEAEVAEHVLLPLVTRTEE